MAYAAVHSKAVILLLIVAPVVGSVFDLSFAMHCFVSFLGLH